MCWLIIGKISVLHLILNAVHAQLSAITGLHEQQKSCAYEYWLHIICVWAWKHSLKSKENRIPFVSSQDVRVLLNVSNLIG